MAGTVQYGWKLISVILELTIGDGRSTLPTTAVWRGTTTPFSTASTLAAGMLTITKRGGSGLAVSSLEPRQIGGELRQAHDAPER